MDVALHRTWFVYLWTEVPTFWHKHRYLSRPEAHNHRQIWRKSETSRVIDANLQQTWPFPKAWNTACSRLITYLKLSYLDTFLAAIVSQTVWDYLLLSLFDQAVRCGLSFPTTAQLHCAHYQPGRLPKRSLLVNLSKQLQHHKVKSSVTEIN